MNGAMCESQEGFATLGEVTQQTFARFSEFMYAGNYTSPDPDVFGDQETLGFSINQDGAPAEEPEASTWPGNSQWDEALEPEPLLKIISRELHQKSPRRDRYDSACTELLASLNVERCVHVETQRILHGLDSNPGIILIISQTFVLKGR